MGQDGAMAKQKATESNITFNLGEMRALAKEGEKIVFTPDAEQALIKFLHFCEQVDKLKEELKNKIYESGQTVMPNLGKIEGEEIVFRTSDRSYGAKYEFSKGKVDEQFVELKTSVNTKKVEEYVKEHGELPSGIEERKREKQLSHSLSFLK